MADIINHRGVKAAVPDELAARLIASGQWKAQPKQRAKKPPAAVETLDVKE